MKTARTLNERIAQLGRILILESDLMKKRNQHGAMPRTNKAKRILWQYQINIFGFLPTCEDQYLSNEIKTAYAKKYTTAQFQGKA